MTISSLDFKKVMNEFSGDLRPTVSGLWKATEGKLKGPEKGAAIAAAKKKLDDYEQLLKRDDLDDLKRGQVKEECDVNVSHLRKYLEQLGVGS